eukprot:448255-Amphidinium_carterae.2
MDMLETALQARQAVSSSPHWPQALPRTGEENLAPPQAPADQMEVAEGEHFTRPDGFVADLEARLQASNLDGAEEIPEDLRRP